MDNSLHLRVRLNRNDEFVVLVHAFNVMLDRINLLIEERTRDEAAKKEYKFKALQSQINPHFLYNTLHSINSLIDLNRVEQIPTVIHSLVQLFQYTMDKQSEFVRIRTELTGLQHYVAIQKIRYRNKFEVRYSVGERMLDLPTLKFILQPIVENAIFHGIEESAGGLITIGGEVDEDSRTVLLFVEDNGVGMPEERLESLLAPRASGPAPTASARLRGLNSIGLRNVHERLQLYFGADYGLRIYSREQAGTRVEIRFPIIHNEDDRPFGTEGQP
jgi:two-component system sensor histidine kinase YesM